MKTEAMLEDRSLRMSGTQTSMDKSQIGMKDSVNEDPLRSLIGSPARKYRSRYTDTQDKSSNVRVRETELEDSISHQREQRQRERGGGDLAELIVNMKKEDAKSRRSSVTTDDEPDWIMWAMELRA